MIIKSAKNEYARQMQKKCIALMDDTNCYAARFLSSKDAEQIHELIGKAATILEKY